MSSFAQFTAAHALTLNGSLVVNTGLVNGVLNTDKETLAFTPVSIDAKGVATWRGPVASSPALAAQFKFSHELGTAETSKNIARLTYQKPVSVTEIGVARSRLPKVKIEVEHWNSMSELQVLELLTSAMTCVSAVANDICRAQKPY